MTTRRNILSILVLISAGFGLSCDSPTDPQPEPAPVATTLALAGPDSLDIGNSAAYTATVRDQYGAVMSGLTPTWKSSAPAVAQISTTGTVTALSAGTTRITATVGSATDTLDLTVYSGSAEPSSGLVLNSDTLTITALGATAVAQAKLNGDPVTIALSQISEARWTDDRAVATISGATITAVGAGIATFEASVVGATAAPDTLVVRVLPAEPYVTSFNVPDGEITAENPIIARGYKLDMASFSSEGDTALVSVVDSATFEIGFAPASGCTHGAVTLTADNTELLTDAPVFARARLDEIELDVGEAVAIAPADLSCVMLPQGRYALAFFDARYADKVPTTAEANGSFTATVRDGTGAATPGAALNVMAAAKMSHTAASSTAFAANWNDEMDPWSVGDTLDFTLPSGLGNVLVRQIVGGYWAIATPVDGGDLITDGTIAGFVDLIERFNTMHRAWLEGVHGAVPAAANGQFLIVLLPSELLSAGSQASSDAIVLISPSDSFDDPEMYQVLAHELTHAYYATRIDDIHDSLMDRPYGGAFAVEGAAEFVATRAYAEFLGIPFYANQTEQFGIFGFIGKWALQDGYSAAAAYFWDLATRLDRATALTFEQAHDSIARALIYNLRGCLIRTGDCTQFDGLNDVMERLLGPEWDPARAVLVHTLSQALDDLTDSSEFQDPHFLRNEDRDWDPVAVLTGGSGATKSARLRAGSTHFFEIDASVPTTISLEADVEPVVWMVARYE